MEDLNLLKRQFLEYLEIEKGRSLKTVENYDRYLTRFLTHTEAKLPRDITEESIRRYRLWLNRLPSANARGISQTLKRNTQNYYLIALRMFLKYLVRRGVAALSPDRIELAKTGARDLDLMTPTELGRLLKSPAGSGEKGLRDRAILELLFSTGLRVSELCRLDQDTIDSSRDEFPIRGKGDKVRLVFLSPDARAAIEAYCKVRKDMDPALFVSIGTTEKSPRTRLTPRSVERLVKYYAAKAGVSKKVTPHTIRHSFATDLLQNGADIRSVQIMLGHSSVQTTQIYTHVTDKELRNIHKTFHGRSRRS